MRLQLRPARERSSAEWMKDGCARVLLAASLAPKKDAPGDQVS
jgi:hypothetical protein